MTDGKLGEKSDPAPFSPPQLSREMTGDNLGMKIQATLELKIELVPRSEHIQGYTRQTI